MQDNNENKGRLHRHKNDTTSFNKDGKRVLPWTSDPEVITYQHDPDFSYTLWINQPPQVFFKGKLITMATNCLSENTSPFLSEWRGSLNSRMNQHYENAEKEAVRIIERAKELSGGSRDYDTIRLVTMHPRVPTPAIPAMMPVRFSLRAQDQQRLELELARDSARGEGNGLLTFLRWAILLLCIVLIYNTINAISYNSMKSKEERSAGLPQPITFEVKKFGF